MRVLSRRIGPFGVGQAALLVVVFAAAAAGAFAYARDAGTGAGTGLAEGEQLVAVQRGNLVDSITTSGSVVFPERETASFAVEGDVADVLVAEGDVVAEGQPLAVIDDATAAGLGLALASAEVKLRDARDALAGAEPDPDAIAAAEADAAAARAELLDAEEKLANARAGADDIELDALRAEVAVKEQELAAARDDLAGATLTAAIDGVVESIDVGGGDRAEPDAVVIEIAAPDAVGETLAFETAGTVGAVYVAEGDLVGEGRTLAVLDAATLADLRKAVADAEVKARDAYDMLAEASGPDPVATARAIDNASRARIALRDAQDAYDDLIEVTPAETADAEAAVADAQEALDNAQADLAAAEEKGAEDVADAEKAVDDAEADYAAVYIHWLGIPAESIDAGTAPETLLAGWGVDLDAVVSAAAPLRRADGSLVETADDPATLWNEATLQTRVGLFPWPVVGTCEDGPPRQGVCIRQLLDDAWDALGDARTALSAAEVAASRSVLAATSAVAKAEDGVAAAEDTLAALRDPDPLDVAAAQAAVDLAEAELADAVAAVEDALAGNDPLVVAARRAEHAVAQEELADARERLAGATLTASVAGVVESVGMKAGDDAGRASAVIVIGDPDAARQSASFGVSGEVAAVLVGAGDAVAAGQTLARLDDATVAALEKAAADAETRLRDARDALAEQAAPDPLAVAKAEADAANARAKLADAEEALADAKAGADALDLALLREEVAVAEQTLAGAESDLAGATLTSPIAGVVESVGMEPGMRSSAQAATIEVVDPSVVEMDGSVDEIDVLALSVGMQASVQLSALGGQALAGEIVSIGAADAGQTGVVTFPLTIRLAVPEGVGLREGLSATAELVLAEHADVLLAPTSAIGGSVLAPTARVASGGAVEEREVTLGPSNDFWVVVLAGLSEGEQIAMPEPAAAADQAGGFGAVFGGGTQRRALRQAGGGGGGGGGGP